MPAGGGAGRVADGGSQAVSGDGDGGVLSTVVVQQVDEVVPVPVGEGEGGDSDGFVLLGQDQAAGPRSRGGPPYPHWKLPVLECFLLALCAEHSPRGPPTCASTRATCHPRSPRLWRDDRQRGSTLA